MMSHSIAIGQPKDNNNPMMSRQDSDVLMIFQIKCRASNASLTTSKPMFKSYNIDLGAKKCLLK